MSKENREPAMALIEQLMAKGMTQTKISKQVGYGPWWVSGIKTKGDGVTDEALAKLNSMVEKRCKNSAKTNGKHRSNISRAESKVLILSLFKNNAVTLPKDKIMQKGLGMGMSCGAIENTLYALKAKRALEAPVRGHYKLPKVNATAPKTNSNGNGNITVNARSFKRLMKDVRIIKKLMRKQEA